MFLSMNLFATLWIIFILFVIFISLYYVGFAAVILYLSTFVSGFSGQSGSQIFQIGIAICLASILAILCYGKFQVFILLPIRASDSMIIPIFEEGPMQSIASGGVA